MEHPNTRIKLKISVYMNPDDHELIKVYAAYKHRSVSEFLLSTAISEINRHAQKFDLKAAVKELVSELLAERFPTAGKAPGEHFKIDKGGLNG